MLQYLRFQLVVNELFFLLPRSRPLTGNESGNNCLYHWVSTKSLFLPRGSRLDLYISALAQLSL